MFIQNIVDWIVESAVAEAEYWNWVSWTDPHPDALMDDPKPTFEEFMVSNYMPQTPKKRKRSESPTLSIKVPKIIRKVITLSGSDSPYDPTPQGPPVVYRHETTLSIKLPKSTPWEHVTVNENSVFLMSTEKYCGSPYFRTVPIACTGQYCFGCIQNNC